MWCHLCTQDYPDFEDFRIHIMEKHRNASDLNRESSESGESEHEKEETSEVDNIGKNTALNMSQDSGHVTASDDNATAVIMSQENCYDRSMTAEDNLDDISASAMTTSQVKCNNSDLSKAAKEKSGDNISASSALPEKFYDSDHSIDEKNGDFGMTALDNLSEKSHDVDVNENQTSTVSNVLRKRKKRSIKGGKPGPKTAVLKKSLKEAETSPILKKRVRKRKKKVVFSKNVLFKRKKTATSHTKATPEHSDGNEMSDHCENSFNENNVDSQPALNNFVNPQAVNNCINSQTVPNNNQVIFLNPYTGQNVNNYVLGNQALQSPFYVVNTVAPNSTPSKTDGNFDFNSRNILKWLLKYKEICKGFEYPLPSSTFNLVKVVHKGIFDRYCTASIGEETSAVLKVYEELDCMIHRHINSVNNALNIF